MRLFRRATTQEDGNACTSYVPSQAFLFYLTGTGLRRTVKLEEQSFASRWTQRFRIWNSMTWAAEKHKSSPRPKNWLVIAILSNQTRPAELRVYSIAIRKRLSFAAVKLLCKRIWTFTNSPSTWGRYYDAIISWFLVHPPPMRFKHDASISCWSSH